MWDLNDPPDQWKSYEYEGCSSSLNHDKGERVGSSSPVVLQDGLEEKDSDKAGSRELEKKSIKIFGFSVTHDDSDQPLVTRQQRSHSKGISRMWDLNDSPDQSKNYEYEDCSSSLNDDKGKRVGSVSNSSSSPVVLENGLEEEDRDKGGSRTLEKKTVQIFGFSVTHHHTDHPPITRQFFPVEDSDLPVSEAGGGRSSSFPRAHWVGAKFCQSETLGTGKSVKVREKMKKSRRAPPSRSSQYRGVTFYRRTGRWRSHIWDCGKQVYLGGFDSAHAAARAYDRVAIKFQGVDADINFNIEDYEEDLKKMMNLTREEFVHLLRRQSTGFSRGSSKYRGVTLHKCGRWEAQMGQFLGKKYVYLGLFDTEIEAARAHFAKICIGEEAVTNFDPASMINVVDERNDERLHERSDNEMQNQGNESLYDNFRGKAKISDSISSLLSLSESSDKGTDLSNSHDYSGPS